MHRCFFISVLSILLCSGWLVREISAQDRCQPVGWATRNGGVTGGGAAAAVVASNYSELKSALTSASVKVVQVKGTIRVPGNGRITIQDMSNKSIFGLAGSRLVSEDQTKGGSGILYIKRCKNFILRNLVFEGPGAYDVDGSDNLCIDNSQNFWIDHCEFHDGVDGNFDIKNQADFISVTWCTFSYEKNPRSGGSGGSSDHRYSNLIGSSDGATGDAGHLNVTFNYCWWRDGCRERMPRMRYGKLHMVNNLFSSNVANHCIRAGYKADVLAVGNYFDNQPLPIDKFKNDFTAIRAYDNYGLRDISINSAFTPPYALDVAQASDIVEPITSCAGATLTAQDGCSSCGEAANEKPTVRITSPEHNSSIDAPAAITVSAVAEDKDGSVVKVEFLCGDTLIGTDNSSPYSITWEDDGKGAFVITAVATDDKGTSATSAPVTITVNDPDLPSLTVTGTAAQVVDSGSAVIPMVFTWGGAANNVNYTTLPEGLSAVKERSAKTLTISGIPEKNGTFAVSTEGGDSVVTVHASVSMKVPGMVLADWYSFQEEQVSLRFISFSDASVAPGYHDQEKPDNGVAYSPGALRLNKGTGEVVFTLRVLTALKIRWYATGGRTLKISFGSTGTEHTWMSPSPYESGAHEFDLTSMVPELVSETPIMVRIINDRSDGGSFNIHDLYVEGALSEGTESRYTRLQPRKSLEYTLTVAGNRLTLKQNGRVSLNLHTQVYILNILGKAVLSRDVSSSLDITRLSRGIYFLKIDGVRKRFVKH